MVDGKRKKNSTEVSVPYNKAENADVISPEHNTDKMKRRSAFKLPNAIDSPRFSDADHS